MHTRVIIASTGLAAAVIVLGQIQADAGTTGEVASPPPVASQPGTVVATGGGTGPDVIVGDLPDTVRWATNGTETAYSFATTSCNIGTENLDWIDGGPFHPVIAQNMYRLSTDGRFEQIGLSWLKHGFCALQQNLTGCGTCDTGFACLSYLQPNCADPYSANRNGGPGGLGPRWEVDPHTGVFPFPPDNGEGTSGSYVRRVRVQNTDVEAGSNPGALYFIEGQYVTQDDSAAGNQNNNASYRQVTIQGDLDLDLMNSTQQTKPAIQAWKDIDATVDLVNVQVPGDGLFIVGSKVTDNGNGTWNYEYAVYNMNSDRSGGSFSIPVGTASISNVGFHDVTYHSGDGIGGTNYDDTDWTHTVAGGAITWDVTSLDANANALRWGTLYNFRFTANAAETDVTGTLGLFKSGSPADMTFTTDGPDSSGAPCVGDLDDDGLLGFTDLLQLLSVWGPCAGCPEDLDGDDLVGFTDLLALLSTWGPCP